MSSPKLKNQQNKEVVQEKVRKNVKVKHVPAYPIAIALSKIEGQPPAKGQIVKLAEHGFMMKIDVGPVFKVSDEWNAQFETPGSHVIIKAIVKVVKTYDAYEVHSHDKTKIYTIEMHFKLLTQAQKDGINKYLVLSGQKKRAFI